MPGRHRHAVDVRTDGLAAVLGRLLDHPAVRSAALVDVDSGMLLDAAGGGGAATAPITDPDVLGALHADLVRAAAGLLPPPGGAAGPDGDVVVDSGSAGHHVVRVLVDPHGGRLALTAVVVGPWWVVERVRRRLRRVPAGALTAGPPRVPRPHAVAGGRTEVVRAPRPTGPAAPLTPPRTPPPVTAVRPAAVPPPVTPPPVPPVPPVPPPLPRPGDRSSPTGPLPTGPRPAPAGVPAGPAMVLLARTGERPAPPPAAALEAPAPVVRRLRPVRPPAARPPGVPAPPSALPPAPPAGGAGHGR